MNNAWMLTDDATGQHIRAIAGPPGAYRFIDTVGLGESQYAVITDEVSKVTKVRHELAQRSDADRMRDLLFKLNG